MATVAPITSPARQPFASLDGSRLRNLTNVKNRQNAIPATFNSAVKRRYTPENFDDIDTENVDPSIFCSKKSKNVDGNPIKALKSPQFVLKQTPNKSSVISRPIITPKRLDAARTLSSIRKPTTSISAPSTIAGRSPKSKRIGILSRRRVSSSPFTRVDPPSFGLSDGLPFSIDAALSGTVSSYKPEPQLAAVSTIEESMPKSWMFKIHEDTLDEELGNLMEFSTQTLDISDDESRLVEKDERGKENIPPDFASMPAAIMTTSRPAGRKDLMTDEPRTPLGDLDAREFYAEGCDSNSYIIIAAEKGCEITTETTNPTSGSNDLNPTVAESEPDSTWKDVQAYTEETKKANAAAALAIPQQPEQPIEIWESESAKGEDNAVLREAATASSVDGAAMDLSGGELAL